MKLAPTLFSSQTHRATDTNIASDSSTNRTAKRLHDPTLSNRAFAIFFIVTILIAAALLLAPKADAATSSWIGPGGSTGTPVTGSWNTAGNWSPSGIPTSSTATILNFGGSGSTAYTSTNNITGTFTFGTLALNSTASVTETIAASSGTVGNFQIGDGTATQIQQNNSGAFTIQNNITNNNGATLTLTGNGTGIVTLSGSITETNGGSKNITLLKTGTSTFVLSGTTDNTFSGTTTINGGILELAKTSTAVIDAVSGNITIGDGATTAGLDILRLAGSGGNQIINTSILTFNGTGANAGTFRLNGQSETVGGLVSTGGAGVIEDNNAANSTLTVDVITTNRDFSGIIQNGTGGGILSLTKINTATQTLSGAADNTYTGTTTVTGGILELAKTSSASVDAVSGNITIGDGATTAGLDILRLAGSGGNQIADTSILTFNGTTTNAGTFRMNAQSETVGGISSTGGAGIIENGTLGTSTLTVNNSSPQSFSGIIQNGAAGTLALAKSGSGTQTLTGNNTYTGTTTVNASGGTLEVNNTNSSSSGRISGTSGVTVNNSGGTLLFSGSSSWTDRIKDSATMTLAGGTFNTGGLSEVNGPAGSRTAGIGALTLTATSTINFGTGSSIIEFAGLGAHTPTTGPDLLILNWSGTQFTAGGTDQLLFAGVTSDFTSKYSQSDVSFNGVVGYDIFQITPNYFEVTAVPEPSTWIGGVLTVGSIGWSQRRRLRALALRRA